MAKTQIVAPRLVIDDEVYQEICYHAGKAEFEVSGFGTIEIEQEDGETIARVTSCILPPQKNTSISSEIDGHAMGYAENIAHQMKKDLRWHWHSHHVMEAYWSGDDEKLMRTLAQQGWFYATVFNFEEDVLSAYVQGKPTYIMLPDIETEIDRRLDRSLTKKWDDLYAKNVKIEKLKKKESSDVELSRYGRLSAVPGEFDPSGTYAEDILSEAAERELNKKTEKAKEEMGVKILLLCQENGLSEDTAFRLVERAEELVDEGKFSFGRVEEMVLKRVLEIAADREKTKERRV